MEQSPSCEANSNSASQEGTPSHYASINKNAMHCMKNSIFHSTEIQWTVTVITFYGI